MDNNKTTLNSALCNFHSAFTSVKMEGRNPAFNSRYMTLDGILDAVRKPLASNGLFVTQTITGTKTNDEGRTIAIDVRTTVHHISGEMMHADITMPVLKPDAHGVGGAFTYARRYSICAILAISADDDLDGNDNAASQQLVQPRPQGLRPIGASK